MGNTLQTRKARAPPVILGGDEIPKKPNDNDDVPPDIILDILSRLPAKSVVRFKGVSKLWCSITHSSYFVNLHHIRSQARHDGNTLFFSFSHLLYSPLESTSFFFQSKDVFRDLTIKTKHSHRLCEIINGIVCIHNYDDNNSIDIFNLTTQETIKLPSTAIKNHNQTYQNQRQLYQPCYSFGFNPSTKEYKVLNVCSITRYTEGKSNPETSYVECEIFTLGSNSWRKIDHPNTDHVNLYGLLSPSVCVNGVIHWRHRHEDQEILLAFDLQDEKFQIIQIPEEASEFYYIIQVTGCLALVGYSDEESRNKIQLWILGDNQNQIWVKESIFFPSCVQSLWPVGNFRTGMIVLVQHGDSKPAVWAAYYCDLMTKNLCMIHIPELRLANLPCANVAKRIDVLLTNHAENVLPLKTNAYSNMYY